MTVKEFRRPSWRSPIRGPWLTSVLGAVLLVGIPVMFATGLLSYLAYNPGLPGNDTKGPGDALTFVLFDWPTRPYWLYRSTQGLHVTLGIVLVPVLLATLWPVIPKLFEWPPVRSPAHALERLSLFVESLQAGGQFGRGRLAGNQIADPDSLPGRVPWLNFVRVPLAVAGVLLLVYSTEILRLSDGSFAHKTGRSDAAYAGHWLLVTGMLAAASAAWYVTRVLLTRARR